MPQEIRGIVSGGGGVEVNPITLSYDQSYKCSSPLSGAYINLFGNTISTYNITNASHMFDYCYNVENIPFDINTNGSVDMSNMFQQCEQLRALPRIPHARPTYLSYFMRLCYKLREVPDDYFDTWDFSNLAYLPRDMIDGCTSLRRFPFHALGAINGNDLGYFFKHFIAGCSCLDEASNVPIPSTETLDSNQFEDTVGRTSRLKNFTFATPNGAPYVLNWNNQTLNFTDYCGYVDRENHITGFNSGITADKKVYDDASYQALKNDPDWYTLDPVYSRYNHDSAVNTINSLPDTSAYGINTLKFKGEAGSATDGGAINTLTAEEIAVAAAKGWTVSFI